MSNNDKCVHNPMFHIIKREYLQVQGIFVLCTRINMVMYDIMLTG